VLQKGIRARTMDGRPGIERKDQELAGARTEQSWWPDTGMTQWRNHLENPVNPLIYWGADERFL
jgi:hypothetical protein